MYIYCQNKGLQNVSVHYYKHTGPFNNEMSAFPFNLGNDRNGYYYTIQITPKYRFGIALDDFQRPLD